MPWGRVDDRFYRHAKVAALDPRRRKGCIALYWLAVSWSNDELTDGRIPTGAVRLLGGSRQEADELVRVALWEKVAGGYLVHDFLQFNQSAEKVRSIRIVRSRAGKAGADSRWDGNSGGNEHGKPDGKPNGNGDGNGGGTPHARDPRAESPVSRLPSPGGIRRGSTEAPGAVGRPAAAVEPSGIVS